MCGSTTDVLGDCGTSLVLNAVRVPTADSSACRDGYVSFRNTLVKGAPMPEWIFITILQHIDLLYTGSLHLTTKAHTVGRSVGTHIPVGAGSAGPRTLASLPRAGGFVEGSGNDDVCTRGLPAAHESLSPWMFA